MPCARPNRFRQIRNDKWFVPLLSRYSLGHQLFHQRTCIVIRVSYQRTVQSHPDSMIEIFWFRWVGKQWCFVTTFGTQNIELQGHCQSWTSVDFGEEVWYFCHQMTLSRCSPHRIPHRRTFQSKWTEQKPTDRFQIYDRPINLHQRNTMQSKVNEKQTMLRKSFEHLAVTRPNPP